jgi:hypothetical protein
VTIRQLLQATAGSQVGRFRVVARVLRMHPAGVEGLTRPGRDVGLEARWVWMLKLHLEDPTGELEAVVFGPVRDCLVPCQFWSVGTPGWSSGHKVLEEGHMPIRFPSCWGNRELPGALSL